MWGVGGGVIPDDDVWEVNPGDNNIVLVQIYYKYVPYDLPIYILKGCPCRYPTVLPYPAGCRLPETGIVISTDTFHLNCNYVPSHMFSNCSNRASCVEIKIFCNWMFLFRCQHHQQLVKLSQGLLPTFRNSRIYLSELSATILKLNDDEHIFCFCVNCTCFETVQ